MNLASFLPGLSRPDTVQMSIFLSIFTCSVFGVAGRWPGVSYLLNQGVLLFMCIFTIALPNAKAHYLFSYALMLSPVIDAFSIGLNWHLFNGVIEDFIFYWSLAFALLSVILKLVFSLHQLEIAKVLNNELSPVSDVYKIYAIQQLVSKPAAATASQTKNGKKGAKGAEPKVARNDVEAAPVKLVQNNQNTQSAPIETQVHETHKPEVKQVVETTLPPAQTEQAPESHVELRAESEQPN